jgi:hypothetical protein
MELQTQQHVQNHAAIIEHAKKIAALAHQKHAKIKGAFYKVPDFHPPTEIFIADGKNVKQTIINFKNKRDEKLFRCVS